MPLLKSFITLSCRRRCGPLPLLAAVCLFFTHIGSQAATAQAESANRSEDSPYAVSSSAAVTERAPDVRPEYANLYYRRIPKPNFLSNPRVDAKGIYVTRYSAASTSKLDNLLRLLATTDLNALVIDVKDDRGDPLFPIQAAKRYNPKARKPILKDIRPLMKRLREHQVYAIARIVTFKDPSYAAAHPARAIADPATGRPYESRDGLTWASPFDPDFRAYNLAVAKEAAAAGFQEIQFDYVRFPDVSRSRRLDYRDASGRSKAQAIQSFLLEARTELAPLEVYVAADVFGLVCTTQDDMNIGQFWEAVSNAVDYLCPMMYPSHYGPNVYGFPIPDREPHGVIARGLEDALRRNAKLSSPAELRPWLQAFTASWIKGYRPYGVAEVQAQIRACREHGIDSYLIWNPSNRYTAAAYR